MTKRNLFHTSRFAFFVGLLALALVPELAFAANAGALADNLRTQFGSFADVIMGGSFLAGIGIGVVSTMKFKAHGDNPERNNLKTPMVLALVAAALIGLPAYLTMTKETLLKDGAANNLDQGTYQQIGR